MSTEEELAYRYDLFIATDWRARFDNLIDESVDLPPEGRLLDVNCGTGTYALQLAERLQGRGDVIALDPNQARLNLAAAKANVLKADGITFERDDCMLLPFSPDSFDTVVGDASLLRIADIEPLLVEMVRVGRAESRIVLKMTSRGSFDEFFSIYWEALMECGLSDDLWSALEKLINERVTALEAEEMTGRAGLHSVEVVSSKEAFLYASGEEFLESPLIADFFLNGWLEIVPEDRRKEAKARIAGIIDRERVEGPFEISIKATVLAGTK